MGNPNNPNGPVRSIPAELRRLAADHPETMFIVDEAFADFVDGMDRLVRNRPDNVLVLCSLTKFYAIPGMRLGFAAGAPDLVSRLKQLMPPWSVNTFAQAVGEAALNDEPYAGRTREFIRKARDRLAARPGIDPRPERISGRSQFSAGQGGAQRDGCRKDRLPAPERRHGRQGLRQFRRARQPVLPRGRTDAKLKMHGCAKPWAGS